MIASGRIDEVRVGVAARLDGVGIVSAYRKLPVGGAVDVAALGLAGDTQVNRRYHGGPDKAVYAYPRSGYDGWRVDCPDLADRFEPGAMGENLVVDGLDEDDICLGDIIRCGTATLQVSQPREPCRTFAASLNSKRVARIMTRTGRCGWYLRVTEAGRITAGDDHNVIDRPNPGWTIRRFAALIVVKRPAADDLAAIAALPGLTRQWRDWAGDRQTAAPAA